MNDDLFSLKRFFNNLYYQISDWYIDIRCWFRECCNKSHFHFYKTALAARPFDFVYMYNVELAQLKAMEKYYESSKVMMSQETNTNVLRHIRLLISMLNIILNDTNYYHYDGEMEWKKCENPDCYELINLGDYHCDVKVNVRNIGRFANDDNTKKFMLEHRHELYVMKAKYLYHKIRYYYMETFWD